MSEKNLNVAQNEIEHFNEQASFWWDENGPFKTLHHINPVRTEYVKQFVDLNGKKVLDVGCTMLRVPRFFLEHRRER